MCDSLFLLAFCFVPEWLLQYFGYFMDARPQGVPYEVSVTDEWSFMTLRKPSKTPLSSSFGRIH